MVQDECVDDKDAPDKAELMQKLADVSIKEEMDRHQHSRVH